MNEDMYNLFLVTMLIASVAVGGFLGVTYDIGEVLSEDKSELPEGVSKTFLAKWKNVTGNVAAVQTFVNATRSCSVSVYSMHFDYEGTENDSYDVLKTPGFCGNRSLKVSHTADHYDVHPEGTLTLKYYFRPNESDISEWYNRTFQFDREEVNWSAPS